jgi:cytochrome P450
MLGSLRRMLGDPLGYLSYARDTYGPVTEFAVSEPPAVLLSDPSDIHHVLVANHRAYTKRTIQYDTLATVTGDGLLVSDPPLWTRRRAMVQPGFHRAGLVAVAEHTVAAAQSEADALLVSGATVMDVDEAMMQAALQVVGAALFSTDMSGQAATLVPAVLTALDRVVVRARSPWLPPMSVPTPGNVRLRAALRTIDEAVAAMVDERRQRGTPGDDVLGLLLGEHMETLSADELDGVRNEVVTLLIAGHETVASALTWTWHLLTTHPAEYAQLLDEVDALDGPPRLADLARLRFTRAVFDEALRLYPPAWVITRSVAEPDVLGGYRVTPGTLVLMSTYALHRDPSLWKVPDDFRPQRWLQDGDPAPRWSYLPFGAGIRQCIGKDFALVEGVLMLATLSQRLVVRRSPRQPEPKVAALVTLRPKRGLWLEVHRRSRAGA